MIRFYAKERYAFCETKDRITTGSVGIEVVFSFDESWGGLGKHATFRGSDTARDMAIVQNKCTVPPEVLTTAGGHLMIGVYGSKIEGEQGSEELVQATPTIWADAGLIEPGAEKANIPSTPQTAELVDQILAACADAANDAEDAAEIAQSIRNDADNGEFDGEPGFSPFVLFEDVPGGYLLKIRDILGEHSRTIYNGVNGDDGVSPEITITNIPGGHRVTVTDAEHPDGQSFDVLDGSGGGGSVTVDDEISGSSTNPVQNKVIKAALDTKGTYSKPSGGIPKTDLASAVQTSLGKADTALQQHQSLSAYRTAEDQDVIDNTKGTYSKPSGGIPKTDLASDVQTSLGKADSALQQHQSLSAYRTAADQDVIDATKGTYSKPSGGIPKTDLASDVQTSLGKADTALQQHQDISGKADKITEVTVSTAGDVTQALDPGKIYHFTGAISSLTLTLATPASGQLAQYHFDFDSGSTAPTVTLPGTVTMQGGTFSPSASKHYEIDILNSYGVYVEW